MAQGLPTGVIEHEIVRRHDRTAACGVRPPVAERPAGGAQPVLLVGETLAAEEAANTAGYRFFTDVEAFKQHVRHEVFALEEPLPA